MHTQLDPREYRTRFVHGQRKVLIIYWEQSLSASHLESKLDGCESSSMSAAESDEKSQAG
jgi:hypothetical protein